MTVLTSYVESKGTHVVYRSHGMRSATGEWKSLDTFCLGAMVNEFTEERSSPAYSVLVSSPRNGRWRQGLDFGAGDE